ncbi:MAG: suppressor of fused domain protein [Pirellulales bacterium]
MCSDRAVPSCRALRWRRLYISYPVYLPDEFAEYRSPHGFDCVIAWVIPIFSSEANFARRQGWRTFEDLLTERNPDLLDFEREPLA